jgi:hypothetical protein
MLRRHARGAALAELALTLPLFVAALLGSAVLTEIALHRLKVQEAARFAAWEMPAYSLTDVEGGDARGSFERAAREVEAAAQARYQDLDSVEPSAPAPFFTQVADLQLAVAGGAAGGAPLPPAWNLSPDGRADGRARCRVRSRTVDWLPGDGLWLEDQASVVADHWSLPDGADVDADHPGGLSRQVQRMQLAGAGQLLRDLPLDGIRSVLGARLPDPVGPFVVSRGYRPDRRSPCRGLPGYPRSAAGGLASLGDRLDADGPACFDTAPFRDTQKYRDSLYGQVYARRGAYFMGCSRPEADDPSSPAGCEEDR